MPDFLVEIGCEEIPARMLDAAQNELARRIAQLLARESLFDTAIEDDPNLIFNSEYFDVFGTPRRLAVLVHHVAAAQPDVSERISGPSLKVAFKDGIPTAAADAFAKKVGVEVSRLEKVSTPKGEYLAATVTKRGRRAGEVLAEALPKEFDRIYWPKNMYWRDGKPERFVRPVRWIVAMLDGETIPLEFAGILATNLTRGHRILGNEWQTDEATSVAKRAPEVRYVETLRPIPRASEYETTLRKAKVLAHPSDRYKLIDQALRDVVRDLAGAEVRRDTELLSTVVNLTEWPSAILGGFDPQFLSLPTEVLVTVMRDHQKYFAVEDRAGKLSPHFVAVLNTDGDPDGLIRHGNERVLRARFNDARFFWNTDQKIPLIDRKKMLEVVTFQKDLGSYSAKADRMEELVAHLAGWVAGVGSIDQDAAYQAAGLAKTDLTTELVKEFTELQGIIGGLYAKAQGLRPAVWKAIYDHYKPESMEDSVPGTLEGAVLSIADKADSIAGMFSLGLIPSGSKDPFSLRRQANGIVRIIAQRKLPITIPQLMKDARMRYDGSEAEKKFTMSFEAYWDAVSLFFRERLEFYLRDACGLAYDVVNATLAAGADDVVDAVARAQAVAKVRPSSDFESISVAFKRMKNILRQAAETKKKVAEPFNISAFTQDEERSLASVSRLLASKVKELSATKQYDQALLEISKLRRPIDAFFDKVMVMVEDENLRAQRLGLLQTLVNEFSSIADFSEIVTAG